MRYRLAAVVALACVIGIGASAPRPRAISSDLTLCSGADVPPRLPLGAPVCLRQAVTAGVLPVNVTLEDLEVTTLRVTIANVSQIVRGQAQIDAASSSITFTMVPITDTRGEPKRIETSYKLEPSLDGRFLTYYDIVWYELEVTWPTFFGAAWTSTDSTLEDVADEDENDEDPISETTFTPFPCTHFIGTLFCTNRTWISG